MSDSNNKIALVQTQGTTIAGVSQLVKYMKLNGFDNMIDFYTLDEPFYFPDYNTIIITPIVVSEMRNGEVPFSTLVEMAAEEHKKLIFMIHASILGICDDAFDRLRECIEYYTDKNPDKMEIWYVCKSYADSYKIRLSEDITNKITFKYCPFTSLGIRPINDEIFELPNPITKTNNSVICVTRSTMNRPYRFIKDCNKELVRDTSLQITSIISCPTDTVEVGDGVLTSLFNITDNILKFNLYKKSKVSLIGSFYKEGYHIVDNIENGFDWTIIESILSKCIIFDTDEFDTKFKSLGILYVKYDRDISTEEVLNKIDWYMANGINDDRTFNEITNKNKEILLSIADKDVGLVKYMILSVING